MLVIKKRMQLNNVLVGFGLAFSLGTAMAADPVTVNVSFQGEVTATNCLLAGMANGGTVLTRSLASINLDELKALPKLPDGGAATLDSRNKVLDLPPIALSGCPVGTTVAITSENGITYMANTDAAGAQGVGVLLINGDSPTTRLSAGGLVPTLKTTGSDFTISGLKAGYVRVSDAPTSGSVKALATIIVSAP